MRKFHSMQFVWALAALAVLTAAAPMMAKGPGGSGGSGGSKGGGGGTTSSTINVTSVIHDFATGGAELLMRSDDYNGTDEATYSAADPNVASQLDDIGRWYFYLNQQSVRTIWITPNDAIDTNQPAGPGAGYYWKNVLVHSRCFDQNLNTVPFQNILTSSNYCTLSLHFNWNGTVYAVHMSPQQLASNGPDSGLATVKCNSVSTASGTEQCVSWTITPYTDPGAPHPNVADLYSYSTVKGKAVWTFIGQYYNTFRIDVTNP